MSTKLTGAILVGLAGLLAATAGPAPNTRYHEFTRKFSQTADQARLIAAGCLGGPGTEWLVSGGFQSDGTVVVAGVALGPTLELGQAVVRVLGKDGDAPAAVEPAPEVDGKGKPVLDRKGKPVYRPFAWNHPSATAFVARLSADLKTVKSAARFPWRGGGLTAAAVDEMGHIYLAGPAEETIASVGPSTALPRRDTGLKSAGCSRVYLCKLTPTADRVLWLRTLEGPSDAPTVRLLPGGKVQLQSADLRVLDADGRQESVTVIHGGLTTRQGSPSVRTTAVNPRDGTFVRAGEHHWPTGREPYRDPVLNVHRRDGTLLYELYNWDGPFVGLDNLRLVSDSAVRRVQYDDEGNLLVYAWSDGGNSVMLREPNDIRRFSPRVNGLGMSAWGAGVLSCAYLLRIDTKDYKVAGGTLWLAYLKDRNRPNSIWVDTLGSAGDGSLCIGGRSAYGLIQTGNALGSGEPTGPYVAVLSKDFSSLRFCSVLPGTGQIDVRDQERWGVVRGTVQGKPKVLFLGSAGPGAAATPALPAKFAGGHSDGYLVMLDLSAPKGGPAR